jgi:hypothetical protein
MPNKHVDLFKEIIPAVDTGVRELWDAAGPEGQKEIKNDLWNLTRYISTVKSSNRELQEHFVLAVNHYYNKNWAGIQQHPKLQWLTLCNVTPGTGKTYFHEYIPLKKLKNKKQEFLAEQFPNMKMADVEALAAITTDDEIREYCEGLGWDKKEIRGLKL